jgi:hypothetical protein
VTIINSLPNLLKEKLIKKKKNDEEVEKVSKRNMPIEPN